MKRATLMLAALALMFGGAGLTTAAPITVTSYDIDRVQPSGFGGWQNNYNGTITSNGDGTVKYSGGSGTINDGTTSNASNSQLYYLSDNSVTTLHLGSGLFNVTTIDLLGFNDGNGIPGNIVNVAVTINNITSVIMATGFGPPNAQGGFGVNSHLDLSSSVLSGLATNEVSLKVLSTQGSYPQYYQIAEAQVFGDPAATIPEPSTFAIFGMMLALGAGCYFYRRQRMFALVA